MDSVRTARAAAPTVTDAFGKYSAFSGKTTSIKGGVVQIDGVIRRRVVRLDAPASGRLQDSYLSLPADNARSTVATVQLPGRFLYVELQGLPNPNEHAARRQPYLPMAFTVDITTKTGYLYRLAFSTENPDVDVHLGKVARLPLPQVTDRWTVLALDLHGLLSLVTDGHEHGAHYGYVCGFVFHANMLLRGAFLSDFILTGDTLPDIMALPLPVNTRFARSYGWLWLPEPPQVVDPRKDLSKPLLDSRPWRSPRRPSPAAADTSRASSVAVAPRQTTVGGSSASGGGSGASAAGGDAAATALQPAVPGTAAGDAAVRNAASASALHALSRPVGLAGTYARLPMPPPPVPPPRASTALPHAARAPKTAASASGSAAEKGGQRSVGGGAAAESAAASRPVVETGAAALQRKSGSGGGSDGAHRETTPATSVFHVPPLPPVAPLPMGSPTSAVPPLAAAVTAAPSESPSSERSSKSPGGANGGLQRRDSRLSTGGGSVGSLDSARGGAGRSRSPTAQGHQADRQFDNPSIEPYRHHVAELANSALHETKVSVAALHAAADAALEASGVGRRISVAPGSGGESARSRTERERPAAADQPTGTGAATTSTPAAAASESMQASQGQKPPRSATSQAVAEAPSRSTPAAADAPARAPPGRPKTGSKDLRGATPACSSSAAASRPRSAPPRSRPAASKTSMRAPEKAPRSAPSVATRSSQKPGALIATAPTRTTADGTDENQPARANPAFPPKSAIKPLPTPAEAAAAAAAAVLDDTIRTGKPIEVHAPVASPRSFNRRAASSSATLSARGRRSRLGASPARGGAADQSFDPRSVSIAGLDAEQKALDRLRQHLLEAAEPPDATTASGAVAPAVTLRTLVGASGEVLGGILWAPSGAEVLIPVDRAIVALGVQGPHVGETAEATLGNLRAGRAEDGPRAAALCGLSQRLFIGQHTDRIVAVALSPDGRLLATAQAGKAPLIVLWCLPAGRHVAVLGSGSHGQASGLGSGSLTFSADGSLLGIAGRDDKGRSLVTVLDVRAPQAAALTLAVAVANAEAVAAGRLPRTGAPLPTPTAADAAVPLVARQVSDFHIFRLRFSPYEVDRLVSVGRENVRLWRIRKGHMPGVSVTLGEYARGVVFTDVAFESAAAASPEVRSCESDGGAGDVAGTGGGLGPHADAIAAEEAAALPGCLLVASSAGTMLRVRYATRALQGVHRLHEAAIASIAINDGFCVTAALDGFVRVWPLDFSDFYLEAGHEGAATSGTISPNGLMVAVGTAALHAACEFAVADEAPSGALAERRGRASPPDALVPGTNGAHARAVTPGSRPLARPPPKSSSSACPQPMASVGLIDVVTQKYRAVQRGHAAKISAIAFRPAPPMLRAPESMALAAQGGTVATAAAATRSLLSFNNASRSLWEEILPLVPREVCTAAEDGTISVWVFQSLAQQQYAQQQQRRSPWSSPGHGSPRKASPPPPQSSASSASSPRAASPRRSAGAPSGVGATQQRHGLWEQQFEFSASGDKCTCLVYQPLFDAVATSAILQSMGAFEGGAVQPLADGALNASGSLGSPREGLLSPRTAAAATTRRQQLQSLIDSCHVLACGFASGVVRVFNVPTSALIHELRNHRAGIAAVAYVPDGSALLSAGCDGRLVMWDCSRGYAPVRAFTADVPRGAVLASAAMTVAGDGSAVAVSFGEVLGIAPVSAVGYGSQPGVRQPPPLLPVGRSGAARGSPAKAVGILSRLLAPVMPDASSSEAVEAEAGGTEQPLDLVVSSSASTSLGRVYVLDPRDLHVMGMAELKPLMASKMRAMAAAAAAELAAIATTSQAASAAAASGSGKAHTPHLNISSLVSDLEGRIGRRAVLSLAFNPAGTLLIASTADWRIAGWALVPSVGPTLTPQPARGFSASSAFGSNVAGQQLATLPTPSASVSASVSLAPAFELSGAHTGAIYSAGILGDGTVLYTSGSDSLIRLWQVSKLLPAHPGAGMVDSETSIGALHPASVAMTSVAGGALTHVCDDPRGGSLVASHDAFRGLFDYALSGLPYGSPKVSVEPTNATNIDAIACIYGQSGAPRSVACFRLAAAPAPRPRPLPSSSFVGGEAGRDASYLRGPTSPLRTASPRRAGSGRPGLDLPLGSPGSSARSGTSPTPVPRALDQRPEDASPRASAAAQPAFSPPRTAAAKAADRALQQQSPANGNGANSPVAERGDAAPEDVSGTESEDEDLLPLALRKPRMTTGSLGGDADEDAALRSADEPLVSGLDGNSGEGSESWWAGNTDPATWHDIEPTAVPYAVLQGLVDLLDGKRSAAAKHPAQPRSPGAIAAAAAALSSAEDSDGSARSSSALLAPLEPTHLRRVRRACIDVAPLLLSTVEVRSRKNRPPSANAAGAPAAVVQSAAPEALASYTRACFAWDAATSTVLYCAGSEVTLHEALTGAQRALQLRSWADIERAGLSAHRQRTAVTAQRRASTGDAHLQLLAASPTRPPPVYFGSSPAAVAAAASRRRHLPRGTVLHLAADGRMLLVGLGDCSIGVWQRSQASAAAPWEQVAVLLPPWVCRVEQAAAAAGQLLQRRASALRRASLGGGSATTRTAAESEFSAVGHGGVLTDASVGPSGMFIAATYIKHSGHGAGGTGSARSFRVLVAFWQVADVLRHVEDAQFAAARAARLAADDASGGELTVAPPPLPAIVPVPVQPLVATAVLRARSSELVPGLPVVTRLAWVGMPTVVLGTGGRLILCSIATHSGADDLTVREGRPTVGAAMPRRASDGGGSVLGGGGGSVASDAPDPMSEALYRARAGVELSAPQAEHGPQPHHHRRRNSLASVAVFTADSGHSAPGGPAVVTKLAGGGGAGGAADASLLHWRVHVTSFNLGGMFRSGGITALATAPPPVPMVNSGFGGAGAAPRGLAADLLRDFARPSRIAVAAADGSLCICALEEDVFNAITGTGGGRSAAAAGKGRTTLSPHRTQGILAAAVYVAPEGPEHLLRALRGQKSEQQAAVAAALARGKGIKPDVVQAPVHIEAGLVLCVQVLSQARGNLPWPAPAPAQRLATGGHARPHQQASGVSASAVGSASSTSASAAAALAAARIVSLSWSGPSAAAETLVAGTVGRQVIVWSVFDPVAMHQAGIETQLPGGGGAAATTAAAAQDGIDPDAAVLTLRHTAVVGGQVAGMQWMRPDARDDAHGVVADAAGSLWYIHPPRGSVPPAALAPTGIPADLVLRATRGPVRLLSGHTAPVEGARFGTVSGGPMAAALAHSSSRGVPGGGSADSSGSGLVMATPATFVVSVGGEDGSMRVWSATPAGSLAPQQPHFLQQQQQQSAGVPGRGPQSPTRAIEFSATGGGAPAAPAESTDAAAWDASLDQLLLVQSLGGHVATAVAVSVPGTAAAAYSEASHPAKAVAPAAAAASTSRASLGRRSSAPGMHGAAPPAPARIAVGFDNGSVRVFLIESLKEEGRFRPFLLDRASDASGTTASSGSGWTGGAGSFAEAAARSAAGGSVAGGGSHAGASGVASAAAAAAAAAAPHPSEVCALAWASFPAPVHGRPGLAPGIGRPRVTAALRDVTCLVTGDRLGRVFVSVLQGGAAGGAGGGGAAPTVGRAASRPQPLVALNFSLADLARRSRLDGLDVDGLFGGRPIASISASPFDPALVLIVGGSGAVAVWRLVSSGAPSQLQAATGAELEPHVVLLALLSANPLLTRALHHPQPRYAQQAQQGQAQQATLAVTLVDRPDVEGAAAASSPSAEAAAAAPDADVPPVACEPAPLAPPRRAPALPAHVQPAAAAGGASAAAAAPFRVIDVARVALRVALLSSLAEAAVTQPSPSAYGGEAAAAAALAARRVSSATGTSSAAASASGGAAAASLASGLPRGSPGGAVLAEFSPASPSVVALLVPVPSAALPPAALAALQARGQATVGQALLFFDFGRGAVVFCTPPLPQIVACMAPLPAWPAELADVLVSASAAQDAAAASAAAAARSGRSAGGGGGPGAGGRPRSNSLFSNSASSSASGGGGGGSTVGRVRRAVLGGLQVVLDDASSVASEDPDAVPGDAAEVASAVRLELARGGGFVLGTVTQPQLLVVGAGGGARGQIVAFSNAVDSPVVAVDAAFSSLHAPAGQRVSSALRSVRPRWLRSFAAVHGTAVTLMGLEHF